MKIKLYTVRQVVCTLLVFVFIPCMVYALWRHYHAYAPRFFRVSWLMSLKPDVIYCYYVIGVQAVFSGFVFTIFNVCGRSFLALMSVPVTYVAMALVAYKSVLSLYVISFFQTPPKISISAAIEAKRISTPLIEVFYHSTFVFLNVLGFICTTLFALLLFLFEHARNKRKALLTDQSSDIV